MSAFRAIQERSEGDVDGGDDGTDRLRRDRVGYTLHDAGAEIEDTGACVRSFRDDRQHGGVTRTLGGDEQGLDRPSGPQRHLDDLGALGDESSLGVANARPAEQPAQALDALMPDPETLAAQEAAPSEAAI
jgi:hypothetical protein